MQLARLSGFFATSLLLTACGDKSSPVQIATSTPVPLEEILGRNLVVNGDAEGVQNGDREADRNVAATWSRTADVLAMEYGGTPEEWLATKPGCPDARRRYFRLALAINEESKFINQEVALAGAEAAIDTGGVECALGGWFGAWTAGDASARLDVNFLDAKGTKLGTLSTQAPDPGALPKPENGRASMVKMTATGLVPAGTRRLEVRLVAMRPTGKIDSIGVAMADNLSVVLRKQG
jgi:hypothetical protein